MQLAIDDPAPTFSWMLIAGARGATASCTLAVKKAKATAADAVFVSAAVRETARCNPFCTRGTLRA